MNIRKRTATVSCWACGEWHSREYTTQGELEDAVHALSSCSTCGGTVMQYVCDTLVIETKELPRPKKRTVGAWTRAGNPRKFLSPAQKRLERRA